MKKALVVLVALAFICSFGVAAKAAGPEVDKTVVKTNVDGVKTKTTDTVKKTATTKVEDVKVTEKMKAGDVKKETMKSETIQTGEKTVKDTTVAIKPKSGDVKKEVVTIKSFNANDPKSETDNTITVISGTKEITRPISSNWKQNHLEKMKKTVTITSSYDPKLNDYVVTQVEENK